MIEWYCSFKFRSIFARCANYSDWSVRRGAQMMSAIRGILVPVLESPIARSGVSRMATVEELSEKIRAVINEVTGIPLSEIRADSVLAEDLELDSLAIAEIVVALDERLAIRISDDQIGALKTVNDLILHAVKSQ